MPTIRDYFDREAQSELSVSNTFIFSNAEQQSIEVPARLVANFEANAKYLVLFVPHVSDPAGFVAGVSGHLDRILSRLNEGPTITVGKRGETPGSKADLAFAGRVFIYAEDELPESALQAIGGHLRSGGMHLRFRGPEYARAQTALERPLGFISYDASDRQGIAEPLALALNSGQCPVWFDQYAMRLGDPLEGTLLRGIDECVRCIGPSWPLGRRRRRVRSSRGSFRRCAALAVELPAGEPASFPPSSRCWRPRTSWDSRRPG